MWEGHISRSNLAFGVASRQLPEIGNQPSLINHSRHRIERGRRDTAVGSFVVFEAQTGRRQDDRPSLNSYSTRGLLPKKVRAKNYVVRAES